MSVYSDLQRVASTIASLDPAIESVSLCANFLRRKLAEPDKYPNRSVEELTLQLLEAEGRLSNIAIKLKG